MSLRYLSNGTGTVEGALLLVAGAARFGLVGSAMRWLLPSLLLLQLRLLGVALGMIKRLF